MSFNDFFHKSKKKVSKELDKVIPTKKSPERVEAELKAEFNALEKNYRDEIEKQFIILNDASKSRHARDNAATKVELSLGALYLIKLAREDLDDAMDTALLANNMKNLGRGLKVINRVYGAAPEVRTGFLNKQIHKMNDLSEKAKQSMNVSEILDSNSMEGMGLNWTAGVRQVIEGKTTVDQFLLASGEMTDCPNQNYNDQDDNQFNDYMNTFGSSVGSAGVEQNTDYIMNSAEELKASGEGGNSASSFSSGMNRVR